MENTVLFTQGVWVFFTFVCKRNVLKVILKKSDHLYSMVRKSTMDNTGTEWLPASLSLLLS